MTLKDCPECSHEVSTEAYRCQSCGYPVNPCNSTLNQIKLWLLRRLSFLWILVCCISFVGWLVSRSGLASSIGSVTGVLFVVFMFRLQQLEKNGNDINNRR